MFSFFSLTELSAAGVVTTVLLFGSVIVCAQPTRSEVSISVARNSEVHIEIKVGAPSESWSFLNTYAGALGLGDRVKEFAASRSNRTIPARRVASGEYRLDSAADTLKYTVWIPPGRPADLAHISWLTNDGGVLMLADLLPESLLKEADTTVEFELPNQWSVESSFARDRPNRFVVTAPEKAVFLTGDGLDVQSKDRARVVLKDKWSFSSKDTLKSVSKIVDWYGQLTGLTLTKPATILIASLPPTESEAAWKAETRGSTVLLLLNPNAKVKNWIGQIGIIFTHELFHLWVPNSLSLSGDYDWFFEGFTLYVALQTALKLKMIGFQEYLDTLARVYDSYLSYSDDQSLIEASERRWTSSVPIVYDKGMLMALLFDLTIRLETDRADTLMDRYRKLFSVHANEPLDGNDVIIGLLMSSPATEELVKSYIRGSKRLELEKILPAYGFQLSVDGPKSRLSVRKELNDPQKHLIRSLGYRK
jgi:hypothetical protein